MKKSLLLITDSPINRNQGKCFEPVLRELASVQEEFHFDKITWYGYDGNHAKANVNCPNWLSLVGYPSIGGKSFISKLRVLLSGPSQLKRIKELVGSHDYIHFRGPSFPALLGTLFCQNMDNKHYWIKYAGNWSQNNPPLSYRIQRFMLRRSSASLVTVNGFWPNEPSHIVSFENPCLTVSDRLNGLEISNEKAYSPPFSLIFIGRLEQEKGILLVLDSLSRMDNTLWKEIVVIGDGPLHNTLINTYKDKSRYKFFGYSSLELIHKELKKSHFLLLPTTASEGFPKVIAEAINYGVIPIVSDISSISHYIGNKKLLIDSTNINIDFEKKLCLALGMTNEDIKNIFSDISEVPNLYSFEHFLIKLRKHYINERKY